MKVFVAAAAMALSAIGACGNADELKAAQAKVDALTKENVTLKGNITELNTNLGKATAERDELKSAAAAAAAAAAAPPPAPAAPAAKPAKKGKHK